MANFSRKAVNQHHSITSPIDAHLDKKFVKDGIYLSNFFLLNSKVFAAYFVCSCDLNSVLFWTQGFEAFRGWKVCKAQNYCRGLNEVVWTVKWKICFAGVSACVLGLVVISCLWPVDVEVESIVLQEFPWLVLVTWIVASYVVAASMAESRSTNWTLLNAQMSKLYGSQEYE